MNGTTDNTDTTQANPEEVNYEKMFKDTQAGFTKGQQRIKELEAERDVYKALAPNPMDNLNEDVQAELDDLKYSDPDAWRIRLNEVEGQERTRLNERITETTSKATSEAAIQFELSRRGTVLESFNANSDTPLTDDQLANDIPPRLTKKLEDGEITFEQLLVEAHQYIHTGRAIKGADELVGQPNMNSTAGGTASGDKRPDKTASQKYANSYY